jgi:hypothetical protein
MIGQRLARNLSSGDTPAVREHREEQGIHGRTLLKHIKNFLGTLIDKRNRADLDANHFGGDSSRTFWNRHRQGGARSSGDLDEFAAIYVQPRHG